MEVDREVLEINTLSPISLTKAVLPHFIERKAGHVVYTSSVAGKIGKGNLDLHLLYLLVYSWLANWAIRKIGTGNLDLHLLYLPVYSWLASLLDFIIYFKLHFISRVTG